MEEGKRRVNEEEKQVVENAIYDNRRLKKKKRKKEKYYASIPNLFPKFPSIGDLLAEPNSINRKLIKLIPL